MSTETHEGFKIISSIWMLGDPDGWNVPLPTVQVAAAVQRAEKRGDGWLELPMLAYYEGAPRSVAPAWVRPDRVVAIGETKIPDDDDRFADLILEFRASRPDLLEVGR